MLKVLNYPKITVLRPQGCLNATNASSFERDITAALAQEGNSLYLVDLALVESLDSAGLMALVSAHKLAESLGRSFQVGSVPPTIKIIFELTQLDRVLKIVAAEAALVAA